LPKKVKKKPQAGASLAVVQAPSSSVLSKVGKEKIVWRFAKMDLDGTWSWTTITQAGLVDAHSKLRQIEELTWAEACVGGKPVKRIPVANICKDAQKRLQDLKLNDVDDVWELHLTGLCRIWGLRVDPVFMLVWWDPDHTVCPSKKKHT
jgi:hypothetical protein